MRSAINWARPWISWAIFLINYNTDGNLSDLVYQDSTMYAPNVGSFNQSSDNWIN